MPRLVLKRKSEQSFILYTSDGPIVVTLGDTKKSEVRVSIEAPSNVHIMRGELVESVLVN